MSSCLQIGQHQLGVDQIMTALIRYRLLDTLVGQTLLDEAIRDITLSPTEILAALGGNLSGDLSEALESLSPEDFQEFIREWCQSRQVTADYFQGVILRELRIEKFKRLNFSSHIESEFLDVKSDLDQVEYSWLQLEDLPLAQELYYHLRDDGADFASLAQHQAVAGEVQSGASPGPVPLSSLPVEVATVLRQGVIGQVYGPITVADRFWILRLDRLSIARLTDATRAYLMNSLHTRWLQTQIKTLLAQPGAIGVH
jgi:parvulin-like peptidyl-prolyl isomerase